MHFLTSATQGYILHTQKVRDEDLLVFILTRQKLKRLYRFYGARHSNVHLGYKIDFEIEIDGKRDIPKLRHILHLGFGYLKIREKFYLWQQFCKLMYGHLKDIEIVDSFYFDMMDRISARLEKQNAKRLFVECYVELLRHEGRLHELSRCFFCGSSLGDSVILVRAFLPSCKRCAFGTELKKEAILRAWESLLLVELDDATIDILWSIVCEGL